MDFSDNNYSNAMTWISERYENMEWDWETLYLAGKPDETSLIKFLERKVDDDQWPKLTISEWYELVSFQKEYFERLERFAKENGHAIIYNTGEINDSKIPTRPRSAWQCYKKKLERDIGEDSVIQIEKATHKILRRLSLDTQGKEAVKGLVIGNVQSGKTANMAALMSMAADQGWNMFIILSGVLNNLRKQTSDRMMKDLNNGSELGWVPLGQPKIGEDHVITLENSYQRYFSVCLKNPTRLTNLIKWLQDDPNLQSKMKILIIDDEADQVSVDSSPEEAAQRSTNNRLICNLVNGLDPDGKEPAVHYKAMNYIGYTATPYANILNEAGRESLYPKNFISTLCVSNQYFGPQQIFGVKSANVNYDGLNIVRNISKDDISKINKLNKGEEIYIPDSLKDAINWFLLGVSCMRIWDYKKPISMLIHTSQLTKSHKNVAEAVKEYISEISKNRDELHTELMRLYKEECKDFNISQFRKEYPDYAVEDSKINNYPNIEEVLKQVDLLLDEKMTPIPIEGEDEILKYHKGIHLCIDNGDRTNDEEGYKVRLVYPDPEKTIPYPYPAPAFIVIGGQTLSRGLTIEGLISSYFLRSVRQADSLMQMGRWFGYRGKYELIPRIWLSDDTLEQFEFLSELDQELRDEIQTMENNHMSPALYGPKVKNSPRASFMRLTSKNKSKAAEEAEMDFTGSFNQTYLFFDDTEILSQNKNATVEFLESLGPEENVLDINMAHVRNAKIWRDISFDKIKPFLKKYKYVDRSEFFSNIDGFIEWIDGLSTEDSLGNWNVVLGSSTVDLSNSIESKIGKLGLVTRTRKSNYNSGGENIFSIGTLSNPADLIADIDLTGKDEQFCKDVRKGKSKGILDLRRNSEEKEKPMLLIYFVDKDSKNTEGKDSRKDLGVDEHIAGLCILIPGKERNRNDSYVVKVHIKMPMDRAPDITEEED